MSISETSVIRVSSTFHEVNGMHLMHNPAMDLVLAPTDTGSPTFCLQHHLDETSLIVKDDSRSDFLSVVGPSGRGPYELQISETQPFGIGSMIYHNFSMKAVSGETGNRRLEIADKDVDDGHWVAWKNPDGNDQWSVYWVTPEPYNREDLPGGVPIELLLCSKP
ncbi:hypothetical protein FGADI_1925 [Fusarium gaditjirri]|uniref:Uncharacterized protein n=1 Tax=Fusarium gaditjirri TaxID=282569 RepID=A0A8H4TJJ1_9HYPO|nr:hypothetical protein FGADI_1925 [Fusarium gaditjirri]